MSVKIKINPLNFWRRVARLHRIWTEGRDDDVSPFFDLDAMCILTGKTSDEDTDSPLLSELVLVHLLGITFTDTLLVMTETKLYAICNAKKLQLLKPLTESKQGVLTNLELVLLEKTSDETALKENFSTILTDVASSFSGVKIGISQKEERKGAFAAAWVDTLSSTDSIEVQDFDTCLYSMLSYQDEYEHMIMQDAANIAVRAMKRTFLKEMMAIVDGEKKVPHSTVARHIEKAIRENGKLEPDLTDASFFPVVQSGESGYNLALSAPTNDENMSYDTILCSIGVEYKQYHTHIARTFMIDPTDAQKAAYKLLLAVQEDVVSQLRPGADLGKIYTSALEMVKSKKPELAPYFLKNAGWAIGLAFPNKTLLIKAKSTAKVGQRMTFSVCVGFHGVPLDEDGLKAHPKVKDGKYSIILADTVYVNVEETEQMTGKSSKDTAKVIFTLNEEEDDDDEEEDTKDNLDIDPSQIIDMTSTRRATRSSRKSEEELQRERELQSVDVKIAKHQNELMAKKAKLATKSVEEESDRDEEATKVDIVTAYPNSSAFPGDLQRNQIYCDAKRETVLLPVGGSHIPFHISTIKSISKNEEEKATYLRFNFYYPTGSGSFSRDTPKEAQELMTQYPDLMYIKEMSFRSRDPRNLNSQLRLVKELQKRVRARDKKREEEADLVEQATLIQSRSGPRIALMDVNMRPSLGRGKCVGSLIAHQNGLRFKTNHGEILDIIYSNVKHFFYQSCVGELIVLVHFHLKHPIMIGRTKSYDVQFFTEVVEGSTALDGRRRSDYDPDEIDEENRERDLRRKLNRLFQNFASKLLNFTSTNNQRLGKNNDLEVLWRKEHFKGVPFKEMVKLTPTMNCLVNLTEVPFFVLDLEEVEHIHFERVDFRISKAFDMVVIKKKHMEQDCSEVPQRITAIEMKDFEKIKSWIDSTGYLTFTYGAEPLNWKKIMESVRDELERGVFWETENEEGEEKYLGWNFLKDSGEDEGEMEEDEEESEYNGSESEEEDEEEDEDEYAESDEVEEDESDDDEEMEEGPEWEELEKEAARDDRKKAFMDRDDERERGRKKSRDRRR